MQQLNRAEYKFQQGRRSLPIEKLLQLRKTLGKQQQNC